MRQIKKRSLSFVLAFLMVCSLAVYLPQSKAYADSHIEAALQWAIATAEDDSHGYSQAQRWGPDYDCSSFVISALKAAGFDTGNALYTWNMRSELTKHGFTWIPWSSIGSEQGLVRGDILLNERSHTEIYLGNGWNVGAHSNKGHYATGDLSGDEVSVSRFYYHPWHGVLRYTAPADHTYSEWTTTQPATCIADGTQSHSCTFCGKTETRTTEASGHSYKRTVIKPTCTSDGCTLYTCTACGDAYIENRTPAVDHRFEERIILYAEEDRDGIKELVCADCGESLTLSFSLSDAEYPDDELSTDDETAGGQNAERNASGDINGDGRIDLGDVARLTAHLKGIESLAAEELAQADVNRDGKVNVEDISRIVAHIKGISALK